MDKNKRGFTLIELLAVIVILAIIALIAVPVIMNVITKARVSAFEDSAYGIVKAGEMYYTNALLDAEGMTDDQEFTVNGDVFQNIENSAETLELSGSMPSSGKVTVTKEGKVAIAISNGEYCIRKATTESKVKAEKQEGSCDYKKIVNPVFTTTTDGKEVPACITNNTECTAEDIKNRLKVGVQVNASKKHDFYVMSDNTSENKITLFMSENLGELGKSVAWITKEDYLEAGGTEVEWGTSGNTNKGPITALNYLEKETSNWTNIPLETYELQDDNDIPQYSPMKRTARARLITKSEASLGWLAAFPPTWTSSVNAERSGKVWVLSKDYLTPARITYSTHIEAGVAGPNSPIYPVITISKFVL